MGLENSLLVAGGTPGGSGKGARRGCGFGSGLGRSMCDTWLGEQARSPANTAVRGLAEWVGTAPSNGSNKERRVGSGKRWEVGSGRMCLGRSGAPGVQVGRGGAGWDGLPGSGGPGKE